MIGCFSLLAIQRVMGSFIYRILNLVLCLSHPYLVLRFRRATGCFPNVLVPRTYHEKMLWRKLFDHSPLFEVFSDKLRTRDYVKAVCPSLRLPEVHWVAQEATELLRLAFPVGTVLKANHGCKMNHFIRDGSLNFPKLIAMASGWLKTTYGVKDHQWGYFNVPRRLFLEQLIRPVDGLGLMDISVRCADGRPIIGSISTDIDTERVRIGYFDAHGQRILENGGKPSAQRLPLHFELPPAYSEAVAQASSLSRGIDYARYDFLFDGKELYAGEITVYPAAGLRSGTHGVLEQMVNEYWSLRSSWFLTAKHRGWRAVYARSLRRMLPADKAADEQSSVR